MSKKNFFENLKILIILPCLRSTVFGYLIKIYCVCLLIFRPLTQPYSIGLLPRELSRSCATNIKEESIFDKALQFEILIKHRRYTPMCSQLSQILRHSLSWLLQRHVCVRRVTWAVGRRSLYSLPLLTWVVYENRLQKRPGTNDYILSKPNSQFRGASWKSEVSINRNIACWCT
jgi:hypothetical protein